MIITVVLFVVAIALAVIISSAKAIMENHKWAAIRMVLSEPIGFGQFAFTKDCPNCFIDGREYTVSFFKDLNKDPFKGYRFSLYLVHDEDDFRSVEFGPQDVEASGLDELTYIKKTVYNL